MKKYNIGLIGLAVMGKNLALNIGNNGYKVAVYNRTESKVDDFMKDKGEGFYGAKSIGELCEILERPRKIFIMVKAGSAVDSIIEELVPHLSDGDILIDGGNSLYSDTSRRVNDMATKGILYVGCGISGGEEGALKGPSLMPGGNKAAWKEINSLMEAISAKVTLQNGEVQPCVSWIGEGGAGHFVKMVHNGIEYGDMQIICEGYDIARKIMDMDNYSISSMFADWNRSQLESYLIEITAQILKEKENNHYIVDHILDSAGQKGTGAWTAITALEEGVPLNLITEAVFGRVISAQKEIRMKLNEIYSKELYNTAKPDNYLNITAKDLESALYSAKLISYSQGFELITTKSSKEGWNIDPKEVANVWRGGCIIRSAFLNDIASAYNSTSLETLMLSKFYRQTLPSAIPSLRRVVSAAVMAGLPVPSLAGALSYYDSITSQRLPANLLQAQRDYFGAHKFERTDAPRGMFFHHLWQKD